MLYTHAGSFTENAQGYLVNSAGLYLQGWPVNANGQVQSDPTNLTKLQPINVTAIAGEATPTTSVTLSANVQAGQTISQAAMDAANNPAAADAYSATFHDQFDGQRRRDARRPHPAAGVRRQGHQADPHARSAEERHAQPVVRRDRRDPPDSVQVGPNTPPGQVAAGVIAFTPTGQFDPTNSTGIFAESPPTLNIGASNDPTAGDGRGR